MATVTYFKGDRAEPTGESQIFYGELFYAVKLLEGHLKGQIRWIPERMSGWISKGEK